MAIIVGKLVWDIVLKADNLWVKWIHDRYIMDHDWNSYVTPVSASWVFKFICRAKQVIFSTCGQEWIAKPSYNTAETYKKMRNLGEKMVWSKYICTTGKGPVNDRLKPSLIL